jgi:hypothetical protein
MAHMPDEPSDEFLSHVLPFEYVEEIGHVVTGWARLEHEIDVNRRPFLLTVRFRIPDEQK